MSRDNDLKTEQFRKLFIGGLTLSTTEEMLGDFFGQWGTLVDCVVMKDRKSGRSRGFGFVTFDESSCVDVAQSCRPHVIDGRSVEAKRAMPREESTKPEAHLTVNRLFVGNLRKETTSDDLKIYFEQYGVVTDAEIMTWKESGESRGFGFVTFEDYDPVDKVVLYSPHKIGNNNINVKKALSKDQVNAQKRKDDNVRPARMENRRDTRDNYPSRSSGGEFGGGNGRAYFERYEDRFSGSRFPNMRGDPYANPIYEGYGFADFGYYGGGYGGGPMRQTNDYYDSPRSRNMGPSGAAPYPRSRGGYR